MPNKTHSVALALVLTAIGAWSIAAQTLDNSWVKPADLLKGLEEPSQWLSYHGDYTGQRHSPLTQITPGNVRRLTAQWTFQTVIIPRRGYEGTPLVVDGVM